MKPHQTSTPFDTFVTASLVALLSLGPGCQQKEVPAPPSTDPAKPAATQKSAEPTTFAEVTARLDAGGSLYAYLGTAQWLSGLSAKLDPWRDAILAIPDISDGDRTTIRQAFQTVGRLVRNSGLESVSGVGLSGIALEPGYYQTKMFFHHPTGQGDGYLWKLFGGEPRPSAELEWLPATTAWATFSDIDLSGIWSAIRTEIRGIPGAAEEFDEGIRDLEKETGMELQKLLGSLDGRAGLFLTLDPTNQLTLPLPTPEPLQIPTPALAIALRVKDDTLFDWIVGKLKENPGLSESLEQSDDAGLRRTTVVLPPSIPLPVRPTVARLGGYLFIATTDALVRELAEVQAGRRPGLRAAPEFSKLAAGMPATANQLSFVSAELAGVLQKIQQTAMGASGKAGQAQLALMQKLQGLGGSVASYSVAQNLSDGRLIISHGYQQPANALLLPLVVAPVALLVGIAVPNFVKARDRAQSVVCVNNLKQIGLAARIYATDHGDAFPPDFRSMTNELVTPNVLVCPKDPNATPAATWAALDLSRISYEYVAPGLKEGSVDSQKVLFRCRIHGHTGLADGSVRQSPEGK